MAWASGVFREGLTPKFRGARLAWPKRALVEASPAAPSQAGASSSADARPVSAHTGPQPLM